MRYCLYCAQSDTKLDAFGYCQATDCFGRAGLQKPLQALVQRARNLINITGSGQVGRVVSNHYSKRNRAANDIMHDAKQRFGFVPAAVLAHIATKDQRHWDQDIRW